MMSDKNRRHDVNLPDSPEMWAALGHAIKVERVARAWERKDLAEMTGISYPYLSEIETGKKRPSWSALGAIADALGLRTSDLLAAAEASVNAASPVADSVAPGRPPRWLTGMPRTLHNMPTSAFTSPSHAPDDADRRARLMREILDALEHLPLEDAERLAVIARALLNEDRS